MTLSFDIETVGLDLDDDARASLVKRLDDDAAAEALGRIALSPFTGRVVVVACWDDEKNAGVCLTSDGLAAAEIPSGFVLKAHGDERALLETFWGICRRQRRFATFNGCGFDLPFLVGRSLALEVVIHHALIGTKPWEDTHVDLLAKLAPSRQSGASLDLVCRALGVPTPKNGIDGADVGAAWADGRRSDVAVYCCRDAYALAQCLVRWDRYALGRASAGGVA